MTRRGLHTRQLAALLAAMVMCLALASTASSASQPPPLGPGASHALPGAIFHSVGTTRHGTAVASALGSTQKSKSKKKANARKKGKKKAKPKKKPKPKKKKGKKKKPKPKPKSKKKPKGKQKNGQAVKWDLTAAATTVVVPGSTTITVTSYFLQFPPGQNRPVQVPYHPGPSTQMVHFTATGPGVLSAKDVPLGADGTAKVGLTGNTPGVSTVTASIPSLKPTQKAKQCKQTKHEPCKGAKKPGPLPTVTVTFVNKYACAGPQTTLFDDSNFEAVKSGASPPAFSTGPHTFCLTSITTYHWNEEKGAVPGSLGLTALTSPLQAKGTKVGPWHALSSSGQNGAPNVNWYVYPPRDPPVVIEGTYSCYDSEPATWSWNETSGGLGFCTIQVIPAVLATG